MSDADEIADLAAENEALRKQIRRLERRVVQVERTARTSEMLSRQSRSVMTRSLDQLQAQSADRRFAKERLEEAMLAKDRFLAIMRHEIRTPMNGVIGYIDLLQGEVLGDHQARMVRTLKGSAETLMSLLNDVLDFAKIGAGQLSLEHYAFDLGDPVDDLCRLEGVRASSKGIALRSFVA